MQPPIKRIASDTQCLELVTGASASVASCLNTIGRNVACFMRLLADGFVRATCCRSAWFVSLPTLSQKKTDFATFWNAATGGHHAPV